MAGTKAHDIVPQTLVGISFATSFRAQEFLVAAGGLASAGHLIIKDAVTVVKDHEGKTVVHETIDPTPGRSALSGSMWAGLIGLMVGGPVGWIAGMAVGAGTGVVTAKVVDLGVPDQWITWFKSVVQPDTTTLVLLAENVNENALVAEAARFPGAELVYSNLADSTMDRIREAFEPADDVTR